MKRVSEMYLSELKISFTVPLYSDHKQQELTWKCTGQKVWERPINAPLLFLHSSVVSSSDHRQQVITFDLLSQR